MTKPLDLKTGWKDFEMVVAPAMKANPEDLRTTFYMGAYFVVHSILWGNKISNLKQELGEWERQHRRRIANHAASAKRKPAPDNVVPFRK